MVYARQIRELRAAALAVPLGRPVQRPALAALQRLGHARRALFRPSEAAGGLHAPEPPPTAHREAGRDCSPGGRGAPAFSSSSGATDLRNAISSTGGAAVRDSASLGSSGWRGTTGSSSTGTAAGARALDQVSGSGAPRPAPAPGEAPAGAARRALALRRSAAAPPPAVRSRSQRCAARSRRPPSRPSLSPLDPLPLVLGVFTDGVAHLGLRELLFRLPPLTIELRLRGLVALQLFGDRRREARAAARSRLAAAPRSRRESWRGPRPAPCWQRSRAWRATARTGPAAQGVLRCWYQQLGCWPWRNDPLKLELGTWSVPLAIAVWQGRAALPDDVAGTPNVIVGVLRANLMW